MSPEPAVSVVVPARDAAATISRTLEGLARQEVEGGLEVIVIDDQSADGTPDVVEDAQLQVRLLRGDGSGAGGARNRGAAAARGEILAFTDADCEPQPGWLRNGIAAFANADLVQGAVVPDPAATLRPFDRTVRVSGERGLYETANLLIRRELFNRLGGFEDWLIAQPDRRPEGSTERLRPIGEDMLLGWRARRAGARTTFAGDAVVHHAVFPRGPLGYLREQLRLRFFPAIACRIPEARASLFFARVFLSRRRAAFDLAVVSTVAAALSGLLLLVLGIVPYLWMAGLAAWRAGRRWALAVFAVGVVADMVGLGALAWGSARYRALLI